MKFRVLTCIIPVLVLMTIYSCSPHADIRHDEINKHSLGDTTYKSSWTESGVVRLTNGEFRMQSAPGSASELVIKLTDKRVFGRLNNKEAAAVVLVTDPGGSGTFYDLAVLIKEGKEWINTDTVFLGDRIKVHSITIRNDGIDADMTIHRPGDAMPSPTHRVVQRYTLRENRLVRNDGKNPFENTQNIIGIVWRWQQSLYSNDTKAIPANPDHYTLELLSGGRVNIRADCNLGGGVYTLEDSRISIEITHTTMAACPPDSLEGLFIRDLNGAAIVFTNGEELFIDLKYDSGTMKFSP